MSLVNDALKRAKEAQQQAAPPPPSSLQFRPVEPAQQVRQGTGLTLPVVYGSVALLALVLVWQWAQGHRSAEPREARAATPTAAQTRAALQPPSASATPGTPSTTSDPSPPSQVSNQPSAAKGLTDSLGATEPAAAVAPAVAKEQEEDAANAAAIAPALQPKPAALRLQAIVYNPNRPSALISGKTLFIGDKLGDAKVVAIDRDSATLVGAGKTNILSLPE